VAQSTVEPHGLTPDAFEQEVHSFEFWFQAVEGYLSERPYGHRPDTPEADLTESERDRLVTTLCNYCIGETAALEGASGMIAFAPNRPQKVFLATQVVDEARHLEVLLHRLADLGVTDPTAEIEQRANSSLLVFKQRLLDLVASRDWEAAVFAQNVILECMEFTVFGTHAKRADPVTREVLQGIIVDERRHMGFGENDLGRRLAATPHARTRLQEVRRQLDPLVIATFEGTLDELGVHRDQRPELARDYREAVARLGFGS
jgi:1,2-phenylacetyl-CoA epoxidase catalytic subunit